MTYRHGSYEPTGAAAIQLSQALLAAKVAQAEKRCLWCLYPDADESDLTPESDLCRTHQAEYEGLSENELDRMESEQEAEYRDTLG